MNWNALGAVAELLAASGVIASLVYLATQMRHSRDQMVQNTKAIEAQVAWAHANSVREIYSSRGENADVMRLLVESQSWDIEELERRYAEFGLDFQRVRYLVGSEFSHWSARFISQTSAEERETLALHIKVNTQFPIYRFFVDVLPPNFYGPKFDTFIRKSLGDDDEPKQKPLLEANK
jgi:hypothetical protein